MKINNSFSINSSFPYKFNTSFIQSIQPLRFIADIFFYGDSDIGNFRIQRYINSFYPINEYFNFSRFDEEKVDKSENIINNNISKDETITNNQEENTQLLNFDKIILHDLETNKQTKQNCDNLEKKIETQKEIKKKEFFKSIGIENIQYLLLKLLSNVQITENFQIYYKILNNNLNIFENFFNNKNILLSNEKNKIKQICKLESVILNFIFKFMILKRQNFMTLEQVIDTSINENELCTYANFIEKKEFQLNIDFQEKPIESKFLVYRMRIRILGLIESYINSLDLNLYSNDNRYQRLHIFYFFSYILKEFESKSKDSLDRLCLKSSFMDLSRKFLFKINNLKSQVKNSKLIVIDKNTIENFKENEIFNQLQVEYNQDYSKIKDCDNMIEYHNLDILNKHFNLDLIIIYFFRFLTYNFSRSSIYSKSIENFMNDFQLYLEDKVYYDKFRNKDENLKTLIIRICETVNNNLINSKLDNILVIILKYIFNLLKTLRERKDETLNESGFIFNEIFSDNLLLQINILNNYLYYYRYDLKAKLLGIVSEEDFLYLLKIVIKLNNYIIGLADFIDNSTLFSLSQKYFILMDFFILICEGSSDKDLENLFFEDYYKYEDKDEKNLNQADKNNFYYQSFLQLRKIINLINIKNYEYFAFGCFRLIIQFLYLTRFLKEFLEDDYDNNKNKFKIINECFYEIFEFDWIISNKIKNDKYSFILRYELLILLNAYLEEHSDNLEEKFIFKIDRYFQETGNIFQEILICFNRGLSFNYGLISNMIGFVIIKDLNLNQLKEIYIRLWFSSFSEDKNILLAELYYKLLRNRENIYQELKDVYEEKDKKIKFNKNKIFEEESKKKSENNMRKNIYDLLMFIGKEIEIKFKSSSNITKYKKIYFFQTSKCFLLPKFFKLNFLKEAPRNSIGEKLNYLNQNLDLILTQIKYTSKKRYSLLTSRILSFIINNLNLFNFICVFLINIYLLFYVFVDSNSTLEVDLNSQIWDQKQFDEIKRKYSKLDYLIIATMIMQLFCYYIWLFESCILVFQEYLLKDFLNNKVYFLKEYKDEKDFQFYSYKVYEKLNFEFSHFYEEKNYEYTQEYKEKLIQFYAQISIKKNFLFLYTAFKTLLFNKQIDMLIFSIICHFLYLYSGNHLFLVFPIFSIIKLYPLFEYFLQAILRKYKEFIALLIFIYVVEYTFSWITFLYMQDFMINEYIPRKGDLNEVN